MELPRFIVRVATLFAALLLASCIDGDEEYWLNADGSGRAEIRYSLPASAARFQGGEDGVRRMITDGLTSSTAISDPSCEVTTVGDRLNIRVRLAFASAGDLKQLAGRASREKLPSSATHLAGVITVARHGRTLDFTRTVSAGRALAGSMFLPASQFKGRNLRYIVHLPVAAKTSNATTITDDGRTLTWEVPLARAVREPVVTRFSADIPIPAWAYLAASLAAAALAIGIFLIVRRRRSVERQSLGS